MLLAAAVVAAAACTEDPLYVQPMNTIEVNAPGSMTPTATAQITLPIRSELTEEEMDRRAELVMDLGVADADIPFVTRDDLDVSIEWTVTNQEDTDGIIRIDVNGSNEYVEYVPALFVIDPEEMEEPPPLMGDVPQTVPGSGSLSGVFREDQLFEAGVDLELIGRQMPPLSPFAAVLEVHEDTTEFNNGTVTIPDELFASMIRFDITLEADRHMIMEYTVRVRDHHDPDLIVDNCLDEEEVLNQTQPECGALRVFAPVTIDPFGMMMMPRARDSPGRLRYDSNDEVGPALRRAQLRTRCQFAGSCRYADGIQGSVRRSRTRCNQVRRQRQPVLGPGTVARPARRLRPVFVAVGGLARGHVDARGQRPAAAGG
jgi:hypothetical protein